MPDDLATVLGLLDERRGNVVSQRTRLVNQLHALLRDLLPGGGPTDLTAAAASRPLATVRPAGPAETARKYLARDLVAEIRNADRRLKTLTAQIAAAVAELCSVAGEHRIVDLASHNGTFVNGRRATDTPLS